MQLFVTVEPHVLMVLRQHTPNPEAQLPSLFPPWLVHSVEVRHVPRRPLEVVHCSCLKVTTLKMEKRPSRLLCGFSDLDLRPSTDEVTARATVKITRALESILFFAGLTDGCKFEGQGTLTLRGSQST